MERSDDVLSNDENSRRSFLASLSLARKRAYGLTLMALAGFYIVLANVLVQLIHEYNIEEVSALDVLLARSVITTILTSVFMVIGKSNPVRSFHGVVSLSVLGLSCVSGILFIYLALSKIPVSDVTIIQFTAPIFTSALSVAFLKQSCSVIDIACGIFSFLGLFIMARPTIIFGKEDIDSREISECITGEESDKTVVSPNMDYFCGVLFALIAAILIAIFYILNKVLGKQGDLMVMIFYSGLYGIIVPFFLHTAGRLPFTFGQKWETWLLCIIIGVLSFVHLMFVAQSLQFEDAGPASLIRNADCVYAFLLQYFVLDISPKKLTVLGAAIVVSSTTCLGIYRYKSAKRKLEG